MYGMWINIKTTQHVMVYVNIPFSRNNLQNVPWNMIFRKA